MSGYFIVSLDCEGKWGMADKLQQLHHVHLTNSALEKVYFDITTLFSRYNISATFAFVMAFILNEEERKKFAPFFRVADNLPGDWLSHFRAYEARNELEGWFQPKALDIVRSFPQHEIGCHSFSHRPMTDDLLQPELALLEMQAIREIASAKKLQLSTFIFPRNKIGQLALLAENGFIGYRAERRGKGALKRIMSLAQEFDMWPHSEPVKRPASGDLVSIPAGYFFNWRFSARKYVPPAVTVKRWKNLLDRAADRGEVAHLWFHPHNLITAPGTKAPLEEVLAYASKLISAGRLTNVTQEGYCRKVLEMNSGTI